MLTASAPQLCACGICDWLTHASAGRGTSCRQMYAPPQARQRPLGRRSTPSMRCLCSTPATSCTASRCALARDVHWKVQDSSVDVRHSCGFLHSNSIKVCTSIAGQPAVQLLCLTWAEGICCWLCAPAGTHTHWAQTKTSNFKAVCVRQSADGMHGHCSLGLTFVPCPGSSRAWPCPWLRCCAAGLASQAVPATLLSTLAPGMLASLSGFYAQAQPRWPTSLHTQARP